MTAQCRDRQALHARVVVGFTRFGTQTVAPGSETFRDVIEAFDRRTGMPVVLNTSLNGPGEPICETPEHALAFLRRTAADVLYVENNRIRRRSA